MKQNKPKLVTIFLVSLLLFAHIPVAALNDNTQPTITPDIVKTLSSVATMKASINQHYQTDVDALMAATTDFTDTDNDGLPDSVELVLGTDINNSDTDFDRLNDSFEVHNNLNPLDQDSNMDGMSDFFEVTNVPLDPDNDSFPNQWDLDNDGDGVMDSLDLSPFSTTHVKENFSFDIKTDGKPTYMTFQVRPKNPNHLTLLTGSWDWPKDSKGNIMDLDDSENDIKIIPLLELTMDPIPTQESVIDYRISIESNKAYVPLLPASELGITTAMNGKMYLPESTLQNYSLEARLLWKINVDTDTRRDIINLQTHDNSLLMLDNTTNTFITGIDAACNNFTFIEFGNDMAALRDCNGKYISVTGTNITTKDSIGDEEVFNITQIDDQIALKTNDEKYLSIKNGILHADTTTITFQEKFNKIRIGSIIDTQSITMVKYKEDFMITGFSVEEHFGTKTGVFYSDDLNSTLEAGFVMSYHFLRNGTATMADIPNKFNDQGIIGMQHDMDSFDHRDTALFTMAREMTPNAIDNLPNEDLPIIQAFEDKTKNIALDDFEHHSNDFVIDLTVENTTTTRTMKMNFYNSSDDSVMNTEGVLGLLESYTENMESSRRSMFTAIITTWSLGETTITQSGDDILEFDSQEAQDVLGDIQFFGFESFNIGYMATQKSTYNFIKYFANADIAKVFKSSKDFTKTIKLLKEAKHFKTAKGLKFMKNLGKLMEYIGIAIDITVAVWGWIAISEAHDGSSFGVYVGFIHFLFTICYAIAYIAIAAIPFVGWAIALVLGIFDWLWGMGEKWLSAIIDWITEVRERSSVDLDFIETKLEVQDRDNNGHDVGDRIDFKTKINGIVTVPSGNVADLTQSYIIPSFQLNPDYTHHIWLYNNYFFNDWGSYSNQTAPPVFTSTTKTTPYDVGLWIEPRVGLVNFPIPIQIVNDYRIYYDECVSLFFGVKGSYICSRDDKTDTTISDMSTISVDVLPNDLTNFTNRWYRYAEDYDGDGLKRNDDPADWSWDADGDGISDGYEKELGTDITHSDTDRDGLSDKMELYYGTDMFDWDTDGDRLEDFLEIQGWSITISYEGQEFNLTVHSNPLEADADHDGIDDQMERWSGLNPNSKDTNGDGIDDVENPTYVTYVYFEDEWNKNFTNLKGIDVDNQGSVYLLDNDKIKKFDTDGNIQTTWDTNNCSVSLASDHSGNVYTVIGEPYFENNCPDPHLLKYAPNGTPSELYSMINYNYPGKIDVDTDENIYAIEPWMTLQPYPNYIFGGCIEKISPQGTRISYTCTENMASGENIAVSKDYIYAVGGGETTIPMFKFHKNGTFIKTWGGQGTESGQWSHPYGLTTDPRGFVYVADSGNSRFQKFDHDGYFIMRWGSYGTQNCPPGESDCECTSGNCQIRNPSDIAVDNKLNIYAIDKSGYYDTILKKYIYNDSVKKYSQYTEVDFYNQTLSNVTDTDEDGLVDLQEITGRSITFVNSSGEYTIHVNSSHLMKDSDLDGLNDNNESTFTSNPRSVDTDTDGLSDYVESVIGTNISHYDTDGEGLDDATEITFGSDPFIQDTDDDGLDDYLEFQLLSNPRNNDTDGDGLTDLEEYEFNSSLISTDGDGDSLLDVQEKMLGSNPNKGDTDGDNLSDGYEAFFNTSVLLNDSDNDGIPDGIEVEMRINPAVNDTDGDGIPDGEEVEKGLNPLDSDSDNDGKSDSEDFDNEISHVPNIILSMDWHDENFVTELSKYSNITVIDPADLDNYKDEKYIVFVGRPSTSPLGQIVDNILNDTGSIKNEMKSSDFPMIVARYGTWTNPQTVLILNKLGLSSHYRVLELLKGTTVIKKNSSVHVEYAAKSDSFSINMIDSVKQTDSMVKAKLSENITSLIKMTRYNSSTVPHSFSGLPSEEPTGNFIEIHINNTNEIKTGQLIMFYKDSELDRTNDGDSNDLEDLDEYSLGINYYDNKTASWIRLSTDLDWVYNMTHNTTDFELYGEYYSGYIWAEVTHFSLYGLSAIPNDLNNNCTNKPDYSLCSNNLVCDGPDMCMNEICTNVGPPKLCNDNIMCTIDSCNEYTICENIPDNNICDNNIFCDGQEYCDIQNDCQDANDIDCSTFNINTIETCNNQPDNNNLTWDFFSGFISTCNETNKECNQGNINLSHSCDSRCGAECLFSTDCDDNNPSTTDSCNECICIHESTGECINNSDCDNEKYCDGNETCSQGVCIPGQPIDCSEYDIQIDQCNYDPDNNPYTLDYYSFTSICKEHIDQCTKGVTPSGDFLLDGMGLGMTHTCNKDTCKAECITDANCNDNNPNTLDSCDGCICFNEKIGECINDSDCDNNKYCDGNETCSQGVCIPGQPVDCSNFNILINQCDYDPDNNSYTLDYYSFTSICKEHIDQCTKGVTSAGEFLLDGMGLGMTHTCNEDTCNAQCLTNINCDDNNPQTIDSCEECICINTNSTPNYTNKKRFHMNFQMKNQLQAGNKLRIHYSFKNLGDKTMASVIASVNEIPSIQKIVEPKMFKTKGTMNGEVYLDIPNGTEPGTYTARITINDDKYSQEIEKQFQVIQEKKPDNSKKENNSNSKSKK